MRSLPMTVLVAVLMSTASYGASAQTLTQDAKEKAARLISPLTGAKDERLQQVATFDHQVTGVSVAENGRIFVNFPRWSEDVPVSVGEVQKDGSVTPYPDAEWNAWRNASMAAKTPQDHFVTVQSVVADGRGSLWVVDPAAPNSEKTVTGGPKLVQIDLATNAVKRVYPFGADIAGPASYLNDVRLSPDGKFAYMTDSGLPGGIVVADLQSGKAWRVLSGDPSTEMEKDVTVMVDGKALRRPDGRQPMFNADGIALSPDGKTLYWQALTGKTLYKIGTDVLQAAQGNGDAAKGKQEKVATTEPVDGFWMDKTGKLFVSSIGDNAVKSLQPDGSLKTEISDVRLRWPDTFSQGPDGAIYITASHIQDSPWFHPAGWTDKNFTLFKFVPQQPTTGAGK
ncbi:MAG: L-dopachrome tautomerase-related protein [Tardiphaga sp.]